MSTQGPTAEQVIELVKQLPPDEWWAVYAYLDRQKRAEERERRAHAEAQLRRLAAERGLNWDGMNDEERLFFVDDLVHEDRECKQ